MQWLRCFLAAAIFFTTMVSAQSLAPKQNYTLHFNWHIYTMAAALTPDQALLTFSGDKTGDWSLKRITNWSSTTPREETLMLKGFPVDHEVDNYLTARIVVSPDGRYAFTRIQTGAPGMLSGVRQNTEEIIHVVDLQTFTNVLTRDTTDPPLAGGLWRFVSNEVLVANITAATKSKAGANPSVSAQAAAFSVPDLSPSLSCTYQEVYGPVPANAGVARERTITDVSKNCDALIKLAGAASLDDLFSFDKKVSQISKQLNFHAPGFTYLNMNTCQIRDISKDELRALYSCATSHPTWHDSVKTTALSYFVLSIPQAKQLGSVAISPSKPSGAFLATAARQDYLLILSNWKHLSVYPIPALK